METTGKLKRRPKQRTVLQVQIVFSDEKLIVERGNKDAMGAWCLERRLKPWRMKGMVLVVVAVNEERFGDQPKDVDQSW